MFKIAVCDDDEFVCSKVEGIIMEFAAESAMTIDVDVFTSGEELCEYLRQGNMFDLLFLDIEFEMLNGIEVGKFIRQELKDEWIQIVYISAREGYAMELFESRPLNFLVKPLKRADIIKELQKAVDLSNRGCSFFRFQIGKFYYQIPYKDIFYFVSCAKKIMIVTKNGISEYYGKLADVGKVAPRIDFFPIHKSYIVNGQYVLEYRYESLKLANGKILPISQTYRKDVREKLFYRRKGRS